MLSTKSSSQKFLALSFNLTFAAVLSGCSAHKIWSTDNSEEGRKSATTIGAISGALIGGTIGAIVNGKNTGEGIVIGSIAGAALGTGTGAYVDYRNNNRLASGKIKEKEIKINENEDEIQRLRNDRKDRGVSKSSTSSSISGNKKTISFYDTPRASLKGNSKKSINNNYGSYVQYRQAKPFAKTLKEERQIATPSAKQNLTAKKMLDKNDLDVEKSKLKIKAQAHEHIKNPQLKIVEVHPKKVIVAVEDPKPVTEIKKIAKVVSDHEEEVANGINSEGKGAVVVTAGALKSTSETTKESLKKEVKEKTNENDPVKRLQAEAPEAKGDKCQQAAAEAERGINSSSIADKLYYYKRARQMCPTEASYRFKLGKIYSELGKNDDAKNELKESIKLNPTNVEAKDELNYLENFGGIKE